MTNPPISTHPSAGPGRVARWIGTAGAVVLGVIFLVAVWGKVLDPDSFARQIADEGLQLLLPATAIALLVLALEAGLGVALVLAMRRLWVLIPTALLVGFFLFLTGRNYWLVERGIRDPTADCGCFGNLVQRTPAQAFWQDLVLLGLPLALAFVGRPRGPVSFPTGRAVAAVATAAAVGGFASVAPDLPLDDLATRLKPGVAAADLCAGAGSSRLCLETVIPELERGRHLVLLADLADETLTGAVPQLNDYVFAARDGDGRPSLWVVTAATPEEQRTFFWTWAPAFEIREAPAPLLKPLARRLPRSFLVDAGTVTATYSGLPPLADFATG